MIKIKLLKRENDENKLFIQKIIKIINRDNILERDYDENKNFRKRKL